MVDKARSIKNEKGEREEILVLFGERLRTIRTSKGWSQRKLAEEVGVNISAIYLMEKGNQNTTLTTLKKLTDALGVPVAMLVSEEEESDSEAAREAAAQWAARSEEFLATLRSGREMMNARLDEIESMISSYLKEISHGHKGD